MGWLLVAAMAAFQVYDVLRRRDIVLETAEHRFASLARALSEQTASSLQVVDVVLRETASDLQLPQSPGKEQRSEELRKRLHERLLATPQIRDLILVGADGKIAASATHSPAGPTPLTAPDALAPDRYDSSSGLAVSGAFRLPGDTAWTIALSRRIGGPGKQFRGESPRLSRSRLLPPLLCCRRPRSRQRRVAVPARWVVAGALPGQRRRHRSIFRRPVSASRTASRHRKQDHDPAHTRRGARDDPRSAGRGRPPTGRQRRG